jgi:hypothetical protein
MSDLNYDSGYSGDNSNYLIIKGRIKAKQTNIYALLIIIIDEDHRIIVNINAVASRFSMINETEPAVPWYIFNENLNNIKLKGDISVRFSADLQAALEQAMEKDIVEELVTYIKNNDHTKVESYFQELLLRPLSDNNVLVDLATENIKQQDYNKIKKDRTEPKEKALHQEQTQKRSVKGDVYDIDLILAPVSGIPINQVKKGDQIMVRIIDNTLKAKSYIDSRGLRIDGNIIPQQAVIVDIKKSIENEYMILCKLKDGVFGRANETERVKLKTYDEIPSESFPVEAKEKKNRMKERSFPLIAIISGALVFVILAVVILLWFLDVI